MVKHPLLRYGWPVLIVMAIQVWAMLYLPQKAWLGGRVAGLICYLVIDVALAIMQSIAYRDYKKFHGWLTRIYQGQCVCALKRPDLPCSIHPEGKP